MYKVLTQFKNSNYLHHLYYKNCIESLSVCKTIVRSKANSIDELTNKEIPILNKVIGFESLKSNKKFNLADQIVNSAPLSVQPYLKIMRIHRPIGAWLLYWPCTWGIALAASPGCYPDPYLLALFGTGAVVMRGAGCIINDMWDRDIDGKVARTADRPLVNGTMTIEQAFGFLASQMSIGLLILLQLNWYSVLLGASSLGLVVTYPLMKRITHWPQFILGLTFNWGVLLGFAAVHGAVNWVVCLPTYAAAVCWSIIYDTIYAHQDIADDVLLGVKSTAIRFQEYTKHWLCGFHTLMTSGLTFAGIIGEQTWPYYSAVTVVSIHIAWQIYSLNIHNPKDCLSKFKSNHYVGFILFCGILFGNLLKKSDIEKKQVSESHDGT